MKTEPKIPKDGRGMRFFKHGLTDTPTYRSWKGIKQRCLNRNEPDYQNYGARGITICERWINSFENFLEDMGERPDGFTIDRIDNDGNYEPSNCRWADRKTQNNNKRGLIRYEYKGCKMSLRDLAKHAGLDTVSIRNRIRNLGFTVAQAVETPAMSYRPVRRATAKGAAQ